MNKINLKEKFDRFTEYWTPKIIGELNGQYVKLAKGKGELIWHKHDEEDEMFLVVKGELILHFRDKQVRLKEGEICIVPKGVEHKPEAPEEVHLMLFEPKSTAHTGKVISEVTVTHQEWI